MSLIRIGSSSAPMVKAAVNELAMQLGGQEYALVAYFCADTYDLAALASEMRQTFPPPSSLIGCTTAGEIGLSGFQNGSIVAIGLPKEHFVVATTLLPELAKFEVAASQKNVASTMRHSGLLRESSGFHDSFALMLIDGLSMREEPLGRAVQLMLGDIPVIGGSAGDSLHFRQTQVFHNEQMVSNAAVMAIISTDLPFRTLKTQHFERTEGRMVVTEARPQERIVSEINGLPAALEYARIVGIPVEKLSPMAFAAHPVVVRIGGQEYVRSIQKVNPDNSLSFYCAIDQGIVLSRAKGLDAESNLADMLEKVAAEIGPLQAVLACNCVLRTLEFQQHNQIEAISKILRKFNAVGFSTFGELYRGIHVNQTFTGVAFGKPETHTESEAS